MSVKNHHHVIKAVQTPMEVMSVHVILDMNWMRMDGLVMVSKKPIILPLLFLYNLFFTFKHASDVEILHFSVHQVCCQ